MKQQTVLIILITLIIGLISVWYFTRKPTSTNQQETVSPTSIQNSWQTYSYTTNNRTYEFSYPPDWEVTIGGYSKVEPNGFPNVDKKDHSYRSVVFQYFFDENEELDTSNLEITSINGLETYIRKNQFGGDKILDVYFIKLSSNEYIVVDLPVEDPNLPVKPEDEVLKTAKEIVSTFRLIQ